MRIKKGTFFLLVIFFTVLELFFCDCSSSRKIHKTVESETHTQQQDKQQAKSTAVKDSVVSVVDTTKKKVQEITIVEGITTTTTQDTTGAKKTQHTQWKQTKLYISEDDLFYYQNGYYRDSSEFEDYQLRHLQESEQVKEMIRENKRLSGSSFWWWFWLIVLLIVCAVVVYVRIKIRS